jgi:hypothetical protein
MDISPALSGDGLILVFASSRAGTSGPYDLWMSTRATVQDPWDSPVNLGATVNSAAGELECSMSADGLALFFASGRPGGLSNYDLWMTTRKNRQHPWERTVNVGSIVNSTSTEGSAGVSSDMRTLYFDSDRPGGSGNYDLWEAPIVPVADFNGDGTVAIEDLVRLIESWGKDDPSVDIGPGPWGDGIVDAADLEVFMSYWGQEVIDPALVARWKLDEAEGNVAQNSVGDNHGILHGEPLWRPLGGKKAGALQFDGIDGYVSTDFVLNPADGLFSVLAWVQGGVPGQVIISQTNGSNGTGETWLGADTLEGKLMTGLRAPGQRGPTPPMISDAVITDGQWHHVGLVVWENKARELYADGMRVAFDTQPVKLSSSDGGLYFGAGKALDATSFFSGLIDDVRIYEVALSDEEIAALVQ